MVFTRAATALRLAAVALVTVLALALPGAGSAGNERFGVSSGGTLRWLPPDELARELDEYVEVGAQWVRFDFTWSSIEPEQGVYDWWRHDAVVAAAGERGLTLLGVLAYTPAWARPEGTTNKHPPNDLADYASFVRETVARYAPMGVRHWEIWNEPNLWRFWEPCPDVERYTEMLRLGYEAVKEVDPEAVVVSGGLSPAADNGCNIAPRTFLSGMYAYGAGGSFDALGHHPYSFPAYPSEQHAWSAWYQMTGASPSLRSIMEDNGDGEKQIWATEWGAKIGSVDEETQAAMVTEAYALFGSYEWAGPMFFYTYRDHDSFGLVRGDWSRRPAWYAYQEAAAGS
jgi:hypothetical protein